MRSGALSYAQFCAEARLLEHRSHQVASRSVVTEKAVATWEWRHGSRQHLEGNSYLVSTGNVREYRIGVGKKNEDVCVELDDIDNLLRGEEDAFADDEDASTTLTPSDPDPQDVQRALLEFHIVYHTIYQTPVLYFRASAIDGSPLANDVVTRGVDFPGANDRPSIVAMEAHPVLGTPFSFLHPCETAAAMQLLQAQTPTDAVATSDKLVPQYLASWLSLVQPLTDRKSVV